MYNIIFVYAVNKPKTLLLIQSNLDMRKMCCLFDEKSGTKNESTHPHR